MSTLMPADPRKPRRPHFRSGGYSTDFTPAPQGHRRYLLDRIPVPFWEQVQAKAKREKTSLRALILRLLHDWLHPLTSLHIKFDDDLRWLDEIEAQLDSTVPYYLPRLIREIRQLRAAVERVKSAKTWDDVDEVFGA